MRIVFLFLCVSFLSTGYAFGQENDSLADEVFPESEQNLLEEVESTHALVPPDQLGTTRSYQTETVARKNFDEKRWKEIVGDVNFNEVRKEREEQPAEEDEETKSESTTTGIPWDGPLLRLISYAVIIGVVILLVYFIVRNISFDLHIQRTKVDGDLEKPVENIESLDIQSLLDQAAKDGNFKVAVRLYYLRLLKKLNEQGVISWKKDKTNRDYLSELFSRNFFFEEIQRLTISYESVWYGEHSLKTEAFQSLTARFENIHQKIDTGSKQ